VSEIVDATTLLITEYRAIEIPLTDDLWEALRDEAKERKCSVTALILDTLASAKFVGNKGGVRVEFPNGIVEVITQADYSLLQSYISNNQRIQAIKHLRAITGRGLRDAKHAVDTMMP